MIVMNLIPKIVLHAWAQISRATHIDKERMTNILVCAVLHGRACVIPKFQYGDASGLELEEARRQPLVGLCRDRVGFWCGSLLCLQSFL